MKTVMQQGENRPTSLSFDSRESYERGITGHCAINFQYEYRESICY